MQMLTVISKLVYVILAAFILGAGFGAYGILASFLVSDLLSLFTVKWYYSIKKHRFYPKFADYLDLPENFRRKPGDVIDLDNKATAITTTRTTISTVISPFILLLSVRLFHYKRQADFFL